MGYYPLYIAAQAAFAWVFVYADNLYNGPIATAWHALITCTLTQAWFPAHAELWNAPTWFLSALTFATAALPFALPPIARWRARGLRVAMGVLTAISLLMKLAYSYDCNAWFFMEGMMAAKTHPNWMFWNQTRFSPFAALIDVLIGCVACRMVTTRECDPSEDPDHETEKNRGPGVMLGGEPGTLAASPAIPLAGMCLVIFARAVGWLSLNDALTRCVFFVPLFTAFVMRVHAQTAYADVPASERGDATYNSFSKVLGAKPLTYLGAISFPIYILHGPIGQIFYKRAVASKLFGVVFTKYPEFFPAYLGIVLVAAVLTHECFMKNKKIQSWFQEKGQAIAKAF
jgi:peptidoglycan/LPS O-acetylase OafA/YrhL